MQSKNTKDALSNPTEATNEREEFEKKNIGGSQPMIPRSRSRVSPHIEGNLFGGMVYLDIPLSNHYNICKKPWRDWEVAFF
jgi:hypothetical protein